MSALEREQWEREALVHRERVQDLERKLLAAIDDLLKWLEKGAANGWLPSSNPFSGTSFAKPPPDSKP